MLEIILTVSSNTAQRKRRILGVDLSRKKRHAPVADLDPDHAAEGRDGPALQTSGSRPSGPENPRCRARPTRRRRSRAPSTAAFRALWSSAPAAVAACGTSFRPCPDICAGLTDQTIQTNWIKVMRQAFHMTAEKRVIVHGEVSGIGKCPFGRQSGGLRQEARFARWGNRPRMRATEQFQSSRIHQRRTFNSGEPL